MDHTWWFGLCRNALAAVLVLLATWPAVAQTQGSRIEQQWLSLNARVVEAAGTGDYAHGTKPAEDALRLARKAFGDHDQRTLVSLNNLALLYRGQGRYSDAEPLYREALQALRAARHPDALKAVNNLANLYSDQGRYGDAEPLYREALQTRRETLGARDPSTLTSLSNLAVLYLVQGRYGEAEPLFREALQARRAVLGPRHPDTLQSLNNLALLYKDQGRHGEAEPLSREALQAMR